MSSIGERIRNIRKELKLSQQNFGEKLKVSKSHISNIESGGDYPSEMLVKLLGIEYGVNEEWLKYGTGEKNVNVDEKTIPNIDSYINQIYDDHQKYLRIIALLAPDVAKIGKITLEEEPDLINMICYLKYSFSRVTDEKEKLRIIIKFENAFSDYLDVIGKLNSDSPQRQQEILEQISKIINHYQTPGKAITTEENKTMD